MLLGASFVLSPVFPQATKLWIRTLRGCILLTGATVRPPPPPTHTHTHTTPLSRSWGISPNRTHHPLAAFLAVAVYLDDQLSGVTIARNTFVNVSMVFLLGGGRSNVFTDNEVQNSGEVVYFDDRGGHGSGCVGSTLLAGLEAVPYNTSAVWVSRFPALARILDDEPCLPKYNALVNNTYCAVAGFCTASNATIASWGSTAWGNTAAAIPCVGDGL